MDERTLQEWYEKFGYAVHRRCLKLLGSEADADDALHEVFLRVNKYGDTVRDTSDPLGWLYRIADNYCFDLLRGRQRQASDSETERTLKQHSERADPAAHPERTQLVAQVLAACKPRERDAARLYYVDQLTQDEVAQELGVSRKTVKEKLGRFQQVAAALLGHRSNVEDLSP